MTVQSKAKRRLEGLTRLAEKTLTFDDFFDNATIALCHALDCDVAAIGILDEDRENIQILRYYQYGAFKKPFTYNLQGTPCCLVYETNPDDALTFIADGVAELYPEDAALKTMGIKSYRGELFHDRDGHPMGHVFTLDTKNCKDDADDTAFFRLASQRIGAEYQRMQAEQSLKESERKSKMYADMASDWTWEIDDNFVFREISGTILNALAVNAETYIGRTIEQTAAEDTNGEHWQHLRHAMHNHQDIVNFEYWIDRLDQTPLYIRLNGRPLFDDDGRFSGFYGTGSDLTAARTAEQALRHSERKFRDLVEGSIQGMYVHSNWRPLFVNRALAEMFGYDSYRDILELRTLTPLFPPEQAKRIEQFRERRFKGDYAPNFYEIDGLRKDGRTIRCLLSVRIVDWEGVKAIQGTVIDVTERYKAEQMLEEHRDQLQQIIEERTRKLRVEITERQYAQESLQQANASLEARVAERTRQLQLETTKAELANKTKTEFLNNMSHELRTPLNAIIGFSDMIRSETFGPLENTRYLEYINDIYHSGSFLLDIISDILDISKIETATLCLDEETVDIPQLLKACEVVVSGRARERGIKLVFKVASNLPALLADKRRVMQVIVNLLSNAVKFTAPGGKVTIEAGLNRNKAHFFKVEDCGIGIPENHLQHIFEPFGRVENSFVREHEGVGLGLPIAKSLVEQHGGSLVLSSQENIGTVVEVTFPKTRVINIKKINYGKQTA